MSQEEPERGLIAQDGASDGEEMEGSAVGLPESILFGMAGSGPGQVITVTLSALVAATAYGGIVSMAVCTIAMLCIAVSFQHLNMWEQNSGGPYAWVARAVNPYAGFLVGWILLASYLLAIIIDVISIGPATLALLGISTSSQWGTVIAATVLGLLLTGVAIAGIKPSAKLQVGMAGIEYFILAAFALIALVYVFVIQAHGTVQPTWDWLTPSGIGGGTLSGGILVSIFFLAGWDDTVYLNEESENPARNPGKAAIIAVALLGVFYMLMVVAFQGVVGLPALEAHSENSTPFLAEQMTGSVGGRIAAFGIVLAVLATTQAFIVAGARIVFSMGRDRVLPSVFASVHPRRKTPVVATVLCGLVGIGFTWVYVFSSSVGGAIEDLITTISITFAVLYVATGLASAWYYRRRLFNSWKECLLAGVLPLLGAGLLGWVAVKSITELEAGPARALIGLSIAGLIMMVVAAKWLRSPIFGADMQSAAAADDLGAQ